MKTYPFTSALTACFAREFSTVLRNRFLHVFSLLALAGGWSAAALAPTPDSIPFILLQVTLYLVPLFAILIAVTSAHGELEEYPFLLSQPIPRFAIVTGKLGALAAISAGVILLAFLPALFASPSAGPVLLLALQSMALAAIFLALGLAVGFSTFDRPRGLIYSLILWLILLAGFDLLAWFAAHFQAMQKLPGLWLGILMINPLDAVRIATLIGLEHIPFAIPADSPAITLWVAHLGKWISLLACGWVAILLLWSNTALNRKQI